MIDSDEILFKDEQPPAESASVESASQPAGAWKVLIVDDEADVHTVTTYMIKGMTYLGRPL